MVRIDFRPVLYICALHAHRARPLRVFLLYRVDNRIHAYSTRTAPFRASAEVLANYNRQEQAKKVGLGFDLAASLFGLRGLQTVSNVGNKEAA